MTRQNPFSLALAGAGISKASGIPTFQDIPGIKDKLDVHYRAQHPEEFERVVQQMKDNMHEKEPNAAHRVLASHDIPVVTMNVDGLHQKAGSKTIIECHGNLEDGTMVLYHGWALAEINHDAEHLVASFLKRELG